MSATIYRLVGPDKIKAYIGSTTMPLNQRMNKHRSDARLGKTDVSVYGAMREHGPEAFTIESLIVVEAAERYRAEGAQIAHHKANGTVYNMLTPGRTNADRRRAWCAAHPELLRAQRQRRAARLAERRRANARALIVHPENQQQEGGDSRIEE